MDWNDTPEQADFRAQVRELLENKLPQRYKRLAAEGGTAGAGWPADHRSKDPERHQAAKDWADALGERGWAAPQWPAEYGGAGMSPMEQFIFNQEMAEAGAPFIGGNGLSMLGPTLIVHGTEEQKSRILPPILTGEVLWAQGYSEPGAGSDLAGLQTRATLGGDEWVINGQKIWTSNAHNADALFMLARTDPDAPKHRGITFMLVEDIETPGLQVQPLVNMGWEHHFNETFFEDVRIPAANVVGEVNRGWYVGMTLLDYERSNISGAVAARRAVRRLIDYVHSDEGKERTRDTRAVRLDLTDRYIESEMGFNLSFRIISMQNQGLLPNYEASMTKMYLSEVQQRIARDGVKLVGLYANVWDKDSPYAADRAISTRSYVQTVSSTIAGGTSEIQRNIIATRGLGLPRG